MTYYEILLKDEILIEEFGTKDLTKKVVISPLSWNRFFPENWIDNLKQKYEVEIFTPEDPILRHIARNFRIKDTTFLITGRGLLETCDRLNILMRHPNVKEIFFIGVTASLTDELDFADINVPKCVLPWETVSERLLNPSEAIPTVNKELFEKIFPKIQKICEKYGRKAKSLNHVTIDLFYSESIELLEYFRDLGIGTIDMELSAIYRYAKYFNKKAIGIVAVEDRPLHKETYHHENYIEKDRSLDIIKKKILFEIAEEIINL